MPLDIPPDLQERLAAWRQAMTEPDVAHVQEHPRANEAYLLRLAKILLWIAGLGSCFVLAWSVSGQSYFLSGMTLLVPLVAWHIVGLWSWGLLLPISLMGLLALQGAYLLW
jgi:hypothetical protein